MRLIARVQRVLETREKGFSVIEMVVAAAIGSVLLAILAMFLVSALRTSTFAQAESATIDDVRIAVQRIEREIRSAELVTWCAPTGSCLEITTHDTDGNPAPPIRYTYSGTELARSRFNPGTGLWSAPQPVLDQILNGSEMPPLAVFGCSSAGSELRVNMTLHVQPSSSSDPGEPFVAETSIRPRNVPVGTTCP